MAEKDGLMASSFSKLNSEIKKDKGSNEQGTVQRNRHDRSASSDSSEKLETVGKKRSHKDREVDEMEEAKRERDEIRRLLRKENERNRRREQAGKNKTKGERDQDRDISEKIALGQA